MNFETLNILYDENKPDRVHIKMDRPESRNSIDATMAREFHKLCEWLEEEPKILIISGTEMEDSRSGKHHGMFVSGADLRQMKNRRRDDALRGVNSKAFARIHALPMPVIAAINGYALGGGAELAYAADFRLATPSVKIGQPEVGLGITAAAGAMWRLKELVGEPLALDMLLAGRTLSAQEALEARLINAIHEPELLIDASHQLADRISTQDPLAVRLTKTIFHMPRSAQPHVSDLAQAIAFESEGKNERIQAFLDRKRK